MEEIDYRKAKKFFEELSNGNTFTLPKDTYLVFPQDQYEKYISAYDKSSTTFEMFTEKNYGIVMQSEWKNLDPGDIIFYASMRGHKLLLHPKKDVHIKLFTPEDYLMKKNIF